MKNFLTKAIVILFYITTLSHANEQSLKIGVIGGIVASGLWEKIAHKFTQHYHIDTELVISGTKHELDTYVRNHQLDFVTMHSSDTISNLVADGYLEQLTPWIRNSQMIVGSSKNPAKITNQETLQQALKKIQATNSPLLVHPSGGTFEVFQTLKHSYRFQPTTIYLNSKRGFLRDVVVNNGYTLFGVIPFLLKKEHHPKIKGFYIIDKNLQRPYLAAIASKDTINTNTYEKAQKLLMFLNTKEVQDLIASYRIKGFENYPVFFPISNTRI